MLEGPEVDGRVHDACLASVVKARQGLLADQAGIGVRRVITHIDRRRRRAQRQVSEIVVDPIPSAVGTRGRIALEERRARKVRNTAKPACPALDTAVIDEQGIARIVEYLGGLATSR